MSLRTMEIEAAKLLLRMPGVLQLELCGGSRIRRDGQTLDLQTQFLLRLDEIAGTPPTEKLPVVQARRLMEETANVLGPTVRYMASVSDVSLPGPCGVIPARVYKPESGSPTLPVLVYFHGGGWVIGSVRTHDRVCRGIAAEARCIVVSVDYRLAPEHRFPSAVDDATAALAWVAAEARELGADPSRIAVGGDSAGGNLAAVVARRCRDRGGPMPAFQMLIYPVTDLSKDSRSYELFAERFYLTRATMHWFREHYLRERSEASHEDASPLLASDLSGLAPAFVATAGFDPLRDEGMAYAERLREAGVDVTQRCYRQLIHGFFSMSGGVSAAATAFADATAALRSVLWQG